MNLGGSVPGEVASINGGLWRACRELASASTADSTQQQHRGRQLTRSEMSEHGAPMALAPPPPPRSLSAPPQHHAAASQFYEEAGCRTHDAAAVLAHMHEQQLAVLSAQQREQQAWCEAATSLVLGTLPEHSVPSADSLPSRASYCPPPVRCSAPPELSSDLGPVIAEMWQRAEQRVVADRAESQRASAHREAAAAAAAAAAADERLRAEQSAWQAQRAREQQAWEQRRRREEMEAQAEWQARRHELLLQRAAELAASQVQPLGHQAQAALLQPLGHQEHAAFLQPAPQPHPGFPATL